MTETPDYRTLEGLKTHPIWQQLSDKLAQFLEAYLGNGCDKVAAADLAWHGSTEKLNLDMGSRALRDYRARRLLAEYNGCAADSVPVTKRELADLIGQRLRSLTLTDRTFEVLSTQLILLKGWGDVTTRAGQKLTPKGKAEAEGNSAEVDELVRKLERERERATATEEEHQRI